jgi:hypothetical protein
VTAYIIFQKEEGVASLPDRWRRITGVSASSSKRALAAVELKEGGEYVAVPSRSWKPLTVAIEQTTKITIG